MIVLIKFGDSPVIFHVEFGADGILMGRRGVTKNPHDLMLRQQSVIVHGKQERLADRQGGLACMFALRWTSGFPSLAS